jgi:hypothetical protein
VASIFSTRTIGFCHFGASIFKAIAYLLD